MNEIIDRARMAFSDALRARVAMNTPVGDIPEQVLQEAMAAAIAAMREPEALMYMRGGNVEPYSRDGKGRMRGKRIGDLPARDAWRIMIDTALDPRT